MKALAPYWRNMATNLGRAWRNADSTSPAWSPRQAVTADWLAQQEAKRERQEQRDIERLLVGVPKSLHDPLRRRWKSIRTNTTGKKTGQWPQIRIHGVTDHVDGSHLRAANIWLRETASQIKDTALPICAPDEELGQIAHRIAGRLHITAAKAEPEALLQFATRYGVALDWNPDNPADILALSKRVQDELWWRGRLKRAVAQHIEHAFITLGEVAKNRDAFVSDETHRRLTRRRANSRRALAAAEATNETGYTATLEDLSNRSVSNPALRRTELMTRVHGMEVAAQEMGWGAWFLTLTAPSAYHRVSAHYNGASPRDTQQYLCRVWQRARALLAKYEITPFGVRVAEPHGDGTPHWHLLLWAPEGRADLMLEIIREKALQVDGDEPGAQEHRFTVKAIDPTKGSAVGYIAKYLAKNIDGYRMDDDYESGLSVATAAKRVRNWASCWRIRQFQPLGQPPVTVWRELRKADAAAQADLFADDRVLMLRELYQAADIGDWAKYLTSWHAIRGGFKVKVEPHMVADPETGELVQPLNKYGEPKTIRSAVVIRDVHHRVIERIHTRLHEWEVTWGRDKTIANLLASQPSPTGAGFGPGPAFEVRRSGEAASTWTCVNNCNRAKTGKTGTTEKPQQKQCIDCKLAQIHKTAPGEQIRSSHHWEAEITLVLPPNLAGSGTGHAIQKPENSANQDEHNHEQ